MTAAAGAAAVGLAQPASATTTPVPVYTPITPIRVYDTRDGDGPLTSGFYTTLTPNSPPPATELAYLYNLTVTGTVSTGYLAVFSSDVGWPGNSSINWFGTGQLLANNVFTGFATDGSINVLCGGGGSTDFVLDLVAMSVVTDLVSSAISSVARQSAAYHLHKSN